MVSIITSLNNSVQNIFTKTIERLMTRKAILSIFAVAVFLLGGNLGFSQTAPAFMNACPTAAMVTLPAGGGTITFTDANIPTLLGTNAFDPDGTASIAYSASPASVDCASIAMNPIMITVTATDVDGSTDCVVSVTVVDGGPTAVCQDITVDVGSGMVTVMPGDLDNGSSGCVAPTLTIMGGNPTYDCTDIAGSPYTLTLSANAGAATCMATVTVVDNVNPTITCPADITVNTDAGICTASGVALGAPVVMDLCGIASTTNNAPSPFPIGVTTVTWTVTDMNGNTNTCDQDVTVVDMEAPVAMCQDITVDLDDMGNATIVAADIDGGSTDNCTMSGALVLSASQTAFTCTDLGSNMITLTVTDGAGLMHSCIANVLVQDVTPPPSYPDLPTMGTIPNTANDCEATVSWPSTLTDVCVGAVAVVVDSARDEKGAAITILTAGPNHFGDFPVGENTVYYNTTDGMNTLVDSFTVTVVDTEAPVLTCPGDQTQEIASCAGNDQFVDSFIPLASFSDNCSNNLSVTQNPAPNTVLSTLPGISNPPVDGETYMVTITVDDGNNQTTCTAFNVTLSENDAPQPDIAGATLTMLTSTCGPLEVTAPTATDACGNPICGTPFPIDPMIWNQVPGTGPCPGATVFTTFAGAANPQPVPPVGTGGTGCVGGPTTSVATVTETGVIGAATGEFRIESVNLDIAHTWTSDLEIDLVAPDGTTWDLSSDNGVGSDEGYQNTTFTDAAAVNITAGFSPFTGNFQAEEGLLSAGFDGVSINGAWTLSICDDSSGDIGVLNSWSITFANNPTGSIPEYEFEPGNHVITWIYDDGNGNSSSQLQQINVSNDMIDPVVACQDITVELDANGNASIVADDVQAATGFRLDLEETGIPDAGGSISMSVEAPNTETVTFDWAYTTTDPGFEALTYFVNGGPLPNGTVISASTGMGSTAIPLVAGDILTIEILTIDNDSGSGSPFSNVVINNFSPGFTGGYSLGNWVFLENNVQSGLMTPIDGDPSDDCTDVADLIPTLSISQTAFDCSDIGAAIPVTLSVTDEAGNVGSCIAMVTVVDELEPVLTLSPGTGSVADVTVDCNTIPAVTQVFTANDNCDGALAVTANESDDQSNNPLSCAFYNYTITRTWTATDANSNIGTVTQMITVEDTDAPANVMFSMNIPANDTISTDATGCTASVSLSVASTDDCAALNSLTITNNSAFANAGGADASGDYPGGFHAVQFTITDPCGNTSNWTESFWVQDLIAPVASCVNSLNLGLPSSGILVLLPTAVNSGSFDNCGVISMMTVDPDTFRCEDVGMTHPVTLTVWDNNGNSSSCNTSVTIQENNAPTAICQSINVTLDANGEANITAASIDNGSFDDCTPVDLAASQTFFTEADLGTNVVTLTVTDDYGNSSSCNANVIVGLPPTCFNMPALVQGGAGDIVQIAVTASDFTRLVGFQWEVGLGDPDVGEFVGVSDIHPDLDNFLLDQIIQTDSFISLIDTMFVPDINGMDSIAGIDTTYTPLFDNISVTWLQSDQDPMTNELLPITFGPTDTLFNIDLFLTGNIFDVSTIDLIDGSGTTPPQVVYSFNNTFYPVGFPTFNCVGPGLVRIGQLLFAGEIFTETPEQVALVDVDLITLGTNTIVDTDQTETDGLYEVITFNSGSYVLRPSKTVNWSNGIDVLDVGLIQRHTVGNPYVGSAYKKIAADVSGNGDITTFDAVLLNAYIASFFSAAQQPSTPSWQFVDAKQAIPNDQNAFVPSFRDTIILPSINSDSLGNDFVAVKTGDIGGLETADVTMFGQGPDDRESDVLSFFVEDQRIVKDQEITLDFTTENFEQMMAYQWILKFNPSVLNYTGFSNANLPNLGELGFSEARINEGEIILTWFAGNDITVKAEDVVFSLNFEILESAGTISDLFSIQTYENFAAVAYRGDETPMEIELTFTEPTAKPSEFALNQNTPNPFKDETLISFTLPEATNATLSIMDITGRLLKTYEGAFAQGYNEISINRSELPHSGTLFYELKTPDNTASMKMIIID